MHDPVLNTFVHYPEIDLAELIFHELTHRRLFRKNDTTFSESLANTVAEEGVKLWLLDQHRHQDLASYLARLERRRHFYHEVSLTRIRLDRLYVSGVSDSEKLKQKKILLKNLQSSFRDLQRRWGTKALQSWLDQPLTNAHIASLTTYHEDIPKFQKLLRDSNGNFKTFFERAEKPEP